MTLGGSPTAGTRPTRPTSTEEGPARADHRDQRRRVIVFMPKCDEAARRARRRRARQAGARDELAAAAGELHQPDPEVAASGTARRAPPRWPARARTAGTSGSARGDSEASIARSSAPQRDQRPRLNSANGTSSEPGNTGQPSESCAGRAAMARSGIDGDPALASSAARAIEAALGVRGAEVGPLGRAGDEPRASARRAASDREHGRQRDHEGPNGGSNGPKAAAISAASRHSATSRR